MMEEENFHKTFTEVRKLVADTEDFTRQEIQNVSLDKCQRLAIQHQVRQRVSVFNRCRRRLKC